MARITFVVPLLALAIGSVSAQSGSLKASARGGFNYLGNDGEAVGSVSGEIQLGKKPTADFMIVLKDPGGATTDGQGEAIIFLKGVRQSKVTGSKVMVIGPGTFQGVPCEIEITIIDAKRRNEKDQIRVRVLRSSTGPFDHTAKLPATAITIGR